MPKLDEYSTDLKQVVCKLLNDVLDSAMQLCAFLINKHLAGFLDKHKTLLTKKREMDESLKKGPNDSNIQNLQNSSQTQQQNSTPSGKITKEQREIDELIEKNFVTKVYENFILSFEEMSTELKHKIDWYADEDTHRLFIDKFHPQLLHTCMMYAHQFYILVSEYYTDDTYKQFQFSETKELMKMGQSILGCADLSSESGVGAKFMTIDLESPNRVNLNKSESIMTGDGRSMQPESLECDDSESDKGTSTPNKKKHSL